MPSSAADARRLLAGLALVAGAAAAVATTTSAATTHAPRTARGRPRPRRRRRRAAHRSARGRPGVVGPPGARREDRQRRARRRRPQAGINQADVVFEERVEGSVTRLAASSTPPTPSRSARSARPAPPTSAIVVAARTARSSPGAGANAHVRAAHPRRHADRRRLRRRHATQYDARPRDRPAPHNLMLRSHRRRSGRRPAEGASRAAAVFTYRAAGQAPAHLEPVTAVSGELRRARRQRAGRVPLERRRAGPARRRARPTSTPTGVQVAPRQRHRPVRALRGLGRDRPVRHAVPEAQLVGEGEAWVLTAGGLIAGHAGHKPSLEAVTHLHRRRRQPDRAHARPHLGRPARMPGGADATRLTGR